MKKLLLIVALMVSVTGFAQKNEKGFLFNREAVKGTQSARVSTMRHEVNMRDKVAPPQIDRTTTITQPDPDRGVKQCLDSIVASQRYKEIFSYDDSGNHTQYVSYYWDEYDNVWKGSMKQVFAYDAHRNMTLTMYYYWDYDNNDWTLSSQEEFEYDADGNIAVYLYCYWDNNVLIEKNKREATYNANGNELTNIRYDWDYANNDWIKMYRGESEYDADGNLTLYTDYEWIDDDWMQYYKIEHTYEDGYEILWMIYEWMDAWQSTAKGEYEYDSHGNETLYVESMWAGEEWMVMFKYKTEYGYDASGNITLMVFYDWMDDDWVVAYKNVYEYNAAGNVTMSASYGWDDDTNDWRGWEQYDYLYDDATEELTTLISYYWEDNEWIESYKYEYEYDTSGNMTVSVSYNWENNGWVEAEKYEYMYDLDYSIADLVIPSDFYMNNKKLWEKSYSWDGTEWVESGIATYYWSEKEIIDAIPDIITSSSLVIYPNPATAEIHVKFDSKEPADYVMYNNTGQTVMSGKLKDDSTIEIQSLSAGIYFLRVAGKTVKVVKQ